MSYLRIERSAILIHIILGGIQRMATSHQARSPRQGGQDHQVGGDLHLCPSNQGVRDHRSLYRFNPQGRGPQDQARPETDPCRSAYSLQGIILHLDSRFFLKEF